MIVTARERVVYDWKFTSGVMQQGESLGWIKIEMGELWDLQTQTKNHPDTCVVGYDQDPQSKAMMVSLTDAGRKVLEQFDAFRATTIVTK